MANNSLNHEARTRQSRSSGPETLNDAKPTAGAFDDVFQAMTFSLTFTSSQWCLFWRLLNVGCMLSDEVLDLVENPNRTARPKTALLWNELSSELAALLQRQDVREGRENEQQTR